MEFRSAAEEYSALRPGEGLASFLESVSLVADVDELKEKTERVTLITLHQAKGLEFPVVFMVGMEEGIFPHIKSFGDPAQMEEERRLCYVGMTRAQKRLYLVYADQRSLRGYIRGKGPEEKQGPCSRFIRDIPPDLSIKGGGLEEIKPRAAASSARRSPGIVLQTGDRVRHAKFGEGTVISCTSFPDDQEVVVDFGDRFGKKRLLMSFAPLQKVG